MILCGASKIRPPCHAKHRAIFIALFDLGLNRIAGTVSLSPSSRFAVCPCHPGVERSAPCDSSPAWTVKGSLNPSLSRDGSGPVVKACICSHRLSERIVGFDGERNSSVRELVVNYKPVSKVTGTRNM